MRDRDLHSVICAVIQQTGTEHCSALGSRGSRRVETVRMRRREVPRGLGGQGRLPRRGDIRGQFW